MRITVPGNLLLFGEYAITLEGGKGIAVAVEATARIEAFPSDKHSVRSIFHGKELTWTEGEPVPEELRLIGTIFEELKPSEKYAIAIDTSDFFDSSGRKKGYGSSAAVTVALTSLFVNTSQDLFARALAIHRKYQGGRGSGYDIAASLFGGTGLFTGGRRPSWHSIALPWTGSLAIAFGQHPSSTPDALKRFHSFLENHPEEAEMLIQTSNALVDRLISPQAEVAALFQEGWELNRKLHDRLEIPNDCPHLHERLNRYCSQGFPGKTLGAGREIAAILAPDHSINELPLRISNKGLQCKQ